MYCTNVLYLLCNLTQPNLIIHNIHNIHCIHNIKGRTYRFSIGMVWCCYESAGDCKKRQIKDDDTHDLRVYVCLKTKQKKVWCILKIRLLYKRINSELTPKRRNNEYKQDIHTGLPIY